MFIIVLTYKKSLEQVKKHLADHRAYLDNGYKANIFIVSGPKNPRNGGIIVSQLHDRAQLEEVLKQDPFNIHDIADYEITEFQPTKCHANFSAFIEETQKSA